MERVLTTLIGGQSAASGDDILMDLRRNPSRFEAEGPT
jgi:hypothetical protein